MATIHRPALLGAGLCRFVRWDRRCNALGDRPPEALISFYKAHRALLRAKLSILHLRDRDISDRENWRALARSYLELAQTYAGRLL